MNTFLQLREQDAEVKNGNADFTTRLKKPISLVEGDKVILNKAILDSRSIDSGKIVLKNDTTLTANFTYYLRNFDVTGKTDKDGNTWTTGDLDSDLYIWTQELSHGSQVVEEVTKIRIDSTLTVLQPPTATLTFSYYPVGATERKDVVFKLNLTSDQSAVYEKDNIGLNAVKKPGEELLILKTTDLQLAEQFLDKNTLKIETSPVPSSNSHYEPVTDSVTITLEAGSYNPDDLGQRVSELFTQLTPGKTFIAQPTGSTILLNTESNIYTSMPILHGKEGTGKSIIAEYLMPKMLGRNKTFTTCKANTLFGQFAKLQGKVFIVYNESNAKDTFKYAEDVKDAITVEYGSMEKKGVDIEDNIRFFTNFISTTNNIVSFKISPTCRRTIAIEVDGSIANNKQYFNELYADLENDTIVRKFYEELKDRDISNFDTINDRPATDLTNTIKQASLDTIQLFSFKLDDYIDNDNNEEGIDGDDLYTAYKSFYKDNGGNNETIKKKQSFLATFKQSNNSFVTRDRINIDGKKQTRYFINDEQYKIFLEKNEDLIT